MIGHGRSTIPAGYAAATWLFVVRYDRVTVVVVSWVLSSTTSTTITTTTTIHYRIVMILTGGILTHFDNVHYY